MQPQNKISIILIVLISSLLSTNLLAQTKFTNLNSIATDTKNVILIGECKTPGFANSIELNGWYAYITDGSEGLRVISLRNPFNPKEVSFIKFSERTWDIKIKENLAFISVNQGLRIVNIRNPYNPILIGRIDIKGYADGLDLKDNFVYLTDAPGNLKIIDVSNPYKPVEVGNYSNLVFPSDVEVKDNYAYVADENSLQVIDISNPSNPNFVDKFETFAYHLDIKGNYLYLADYHDYLKIFDITIPTHLTFVSQFKTPSFPADVSASSKFAYVADSPAGMRTIDISNPYYPKEVGYYDNESIRANGITSFGRIVFVAGGDKLYILFNTVRPWSLAKNSSELESLIISKLENKNTLSEYFLNYNYPNPFNPSTTIGYQLPSSVKSEKAKMKSKTSNEVIPSGFEGANVILRVYDILGRKVATLVNEQQKPGYYEVVWDASNQPSGVYFYLLTAGDFIETKKMILLR